MSVTGWYQFSITVPDTRVEARAYTREHGEDSPEIRDWTWPY